MKLDFSKFKHVSSTDKTTTLKHPSGHMITLAHDALSPEYKKALSALSPIAKQDETSLEQDQMKHKMADGGKVKVIEEKPQDTGKVTKKDRGPKEFDSYTQNEKPKSNGYDSHFWENHKSKRPQKFAEGTKDAPIQDNSDSSDNSDDSSSSSPAKGVTINIGAQPAQDQSQTPFFQRPPTNSAPAPQQTMAPQQAPSQPSMVPQQAPSQGGKDDSEDDSGDDNQDQPAQQAPAPAPQQAAPQQAAPQPASAAQPAPAQAAPLTPEQQHAAHKDQAKNEMLSEVQAGEEDKANGHITPKTYESLWANKSALGKAGSFLGLLLSGMGSGMAHQSNAVLDAMNKEISNDLEAQKASKENAINYYKLHQQDELNKAEMAYKGKLGTLTEAQARAAANEADIKAFAMARMKMNYDTIHKMTADLKKLPQGPPRQQLEQQLGLMYNGITAENADIADKAAAASAYYKMLGLGSGPEAQQSGEEAAFQQGQRTKMMLGPQGEMLAKDAEAHHLPGMPAAARTSAPVQEKDRSALEHLSALDQSYTDAQNYLKKVGSLPAIGAGERAQGQALSNRLELEIGQLEGLGRFTPEEAKRYKGMIPNLNSTHFTDADRKKVEGLQRELQQHKEAIYGTYGQSVPGASTAAAQGETRTIGGKQYKRVSGGWQQVK